MNLSIEDLVGLQLSMSFSSPRLLGDKLGSFRETLEGRLFELFNSTTFDLAQKFELLVAQRPE